MFCHNCGKEQKEGSRFCTGCGTPLSAPQFKTTPPPVVQNVVNSPAPQKKIKKQGIPKGIIAAAAAVILLVCAVGGWFMFFNDKEDAPDDAVLESFDKPDKSDDTQAKPAHTPSDEDKAPTDEEHDTPAEEAKEEIKPGVSIEFETRTRPQLMSFTAQSAETEASVGEYYPGEELEYVDNLDYLYLDDAIVEQLKKNQFAVTDAYGSEFFEIYEDNRYFQTPNFVTVDSMMHTYHLYFSLLLNRTEKDYLYEMLCVLTEQLCAISEEQYLYLTDTPFEEAARKNFAFFTVARSLLDENSRVAPEVADIVNYELDAIYRAEGIGDCTITDTMLDYSQFKPRGYYEGDVVLEKYFRAMMWYGQINFAQSSDELTRCALLMNLAMEQADFALWEQIYMVTSFFAGVSDDLGYYEYISAIEAAYGTIPDIGTVAQDEEGFELFTQLISTLRAPAINSVPVVDGTENIAEITKGFRFMGQRFTIDAAVMQKLVYSNIGENSDGEKRMLPDALDMPAAMGSDMALDILEQQGELDYEGYADTMALLRQTVEESEENTWSTSLYSGWIYTLAPLLEEKGEGYPAFMQSEEWTKKNLETYLGSYTELKHDTVLYAKQVMAEMGGGPEEEIDDRGYVEPEVEVFRRFEELAGKTAAGLASFGLISDADYENLDRLATLAAKLRVICEKELREETLTDEEYELIRSYGGTLEHFWAEAVRDKSESDWLDSQEIPASLVTDIATDPNGSVLQIANGKPSAIYVIVCVDGHLRIAKGAVYNFYQFTQPIDQRLTDTEWRQMTGEWMMDDGSYNWDAQIEKPWWTKSYRVTR